MAVVLQRLLISKTTFMLLIT